MQHKETALLTSAPMPLAATIPYSAYPNLPASTCRPQLSQDHKRHHHHHQKRGAECAGSLFYK